MSSVHHINSDGTVGFDMGNGMTINSDGTVDTQQIDTYVRGVWVAIDILAAGLLLLVGGGTFLALGMVSAMWEAARSGQGQVVDAAIVDGAGWTELTLDDFVLNGCDP